MKQKKLTLSRPMIEVLMGVLAKAETSTLVVPWRDLYKEARPCIGHASAVHQLHVKGLFSVGTFGVTLTEKGRRVCAEVARRNRWKAQLKLASRVCLGVSVRDRVWKTGKGKLVPYEMLHTPHLIHILRLFRDAPRRMRGLQAHVPGLRDELRDRGSLFLVES